MYNKKCVQVPPITLLIKPSKISLITRKIAYVHKLIIKIYYKLYRFITILSWRGETEEWLNRRSNCMEFTVDIINCCKVWTEGFQVQLQPWSTDIIIFICLSVVDQRGVNKLIIVVHRSPQFSRSSCITKILVLDQQSSILLYRSDFSSMLVASRKTYIRGHWQGKWRNGLQYDWAKPDYSLDYWRESSNRRA